MSERNVRLTATTEGTEKAAKDFEKIADAEKKVGGAASEASKASEEFNINQEAFTQTLNRINPALGGMAEGLLKAFVVAGDLSKVNLTSIDIMGKARGAVLRYKDSLLLLGAGGAAVGAILVLIATWKSLNAEMEKARENQRRFDEDNRRVADREAGFKKRLAESVEQGVIDPGTLTDERTKALRNEFNRLRKFASDDAAFRIATQQRAPFTKGQEAFLQGQRGPAAVGRDVAERNRTGGLTSDDLKFLADQIGVTVEKVEDLLDPAGGTGPTFFEKPLTTLVDGLLSAFVDNQRDRNALLGETDIVEQNQLERLATLLRDRDSGSSTPLDGAAERLNRAAENIEKSTRSQERVNDQAERGKANRNVEPQVVGAIS